MIEDTVWFHPDDELFVHAAGDNLQVVYNYESRD